MVQHIVILFSSFTQRVYSSQSLPARFHCRLCTSNILHLTMSTTTHIPACAELLGIGSWASDSKTGSQPAAALSAATQPEKEHTNILPATSNESVTKVGIVSDEKKL